MLSPIELRRHDIDSILQSCATLGEEDFVQTIYRFFLNREPDPIGLERAIQLALQNRLAVIAGLLNSAEYRTTPGYCASVVNVVKEVIENEHYQDAIDVLLELYKQHSKSYDVCYYLGVCNFKLKYYQAAQQFFLEAYDIDCRNVNLIKAIVFLILLLKDEGQALKYLGQLFMYDSSNVKALAMAAKIYKLAGKKAEADYFLQIAGSKNNYEKSLQNEMDQWEADLLAYYNSSTDVSYRDRIADGILKFETEIGKSFIDLYHDFENIDQQLVVYRKTLEKHPDNADSLVGLAFCLFLKGEFVESERLYRAVLKTNPDNKEMYVGFVGLLERLGSNDEMKVFCERALRNGQTEYFIEMLENTNKRLELPADHRIECGEKIIVVTREEQIRVSGLR